MTMIRAGITWLASYPKSGNTHLRLFLSSYLYGNRNISQTGALNFKDTSEWAYQMVTPKRIEDLNLYDCLALKPAALMHLLPMLASFDRERMFLKTHSPNAIIEGFAQCPRGLTAGAIYIVRDPRDVAISFSHYMQGKTIDAAIDDMLMKHNTLGRTGEIIQYLGSWAAHVASWVDHGGAYVISYEQMQDDPEGTFCGVLEYLGETVDQNRLKEAIEFTSFGNLQRIEREEGFDDNPRKDRPFFRKGKAGQWRDVLTREQVERIEEAVGETMKRFGYELSLEQVA